MSKVEAVIVDLDQTLLHTDKAISAYTVEIFKKCKERGIRLVVATARPYRTITQYCSLIDFDAIIVSNGARIFCKDRQIDFGIQKDSAVKLLQALSHRDDLRITLETGEQAYSNRPIEDYETVLTEKLADIALKEGALKVLVHLDSDTVLPYVQNQLTDDLYYTIAGGHLLQIMNRSATKWNGIKEALKICGWSAEEAIYFGDDQDDVEPIIMCGVGVAVSNAIEAVKEAADYITESNDHDGVAKFIDKYILG